MNDDCQVIFDPGISRRAPIHVEPALNERPTGRDDVSFTESGPAVLELTVNRAGS